VSRCELDRQEGEKGGIFERLALAYVPHLLTSDRTAKIYSIHHNSANHWLNYIEGIHDNALIFFRRRRKNSWPLDRTSNVLKSGWD
jgi:hypothetical protein